MAQKPIRGKQFQSKRKGGGQYVRPVKYIFRFGVGIGITGVPAYFILRNFRWDEWDKLIRAGLRALLEANGPVPFLLAIVFAIGILWHFCQDQQLIRAKDSEITRLVAERDSLQEKLGVPHPSSIMNDKEEE